MVNRRRLVDSGRWSVGGRCLQMSSNIHSTLIRHLSHMLRKRQQQRDDTSDKNMASTTLSSWIVNKCLLCSSNNGIYSWKNNVYHH